eukprot:TRINITY_DN18602_c0_g2_i1.p1 TRINITY_DN18602_c0_g2~~TRINITY_DN18602_c0_g2_i1.p1  ORF type:complete len:349 (-),score=6.02 TRINITY_DN18602_c0_g2_i1:673-1719(-)
MGFRGVHECYPNSPPDTSRTPLIIDLLPLHRHQAANSHMYSHRNFASVQTSAVVREMTQESELSLTTAGPNHKDPADAARWQQLCVTYVVVVLLLLGTTHVWLAYTKRMKWDKIEWTYLSRGRGRCSALVMALFRAAFAIIVISVNVGLYFQVSDNPLFPGGWIIFATFTVWSWTLIGVYMALAAFASLADVLKYQPTGLAAHTFCCGMWVLFEVMVSVAVLITICVWLVLLPAAYKFRGSDMGLLSFFPFASHNFNTVISARRSHLIRIHAVRGCHQSAVHHHAPLNFCVLLWSCVCDLLMVVVFSIPFLLLFFHRLEVRLCSDRIHFIAIVTSTILLRRPMSGELH